MNSKVDYPLHEKIISIQNDLRIAIQNHHVLFLFKKNFPRNKDLNSFVHIIETLILRLGRSQAVLMSQLRHEMAVKYDVKPTSLKVFTAMKKLLSFPKAPKYIPVYKSHQRNRNDFDKRIISCKAQVQNSSLVENHKLKKKKIAGREEKDHDSVRLVDSFNRGNNNCVSNQKSKKLQSILKSNINSHLKKNAIREECTSNFKGQKKFSDYEHNSSRQLSSVIETESIKDQVFKIIESNRTKLCEDSSKNNNKSNKKIISQTLRSGNEETVSSDNSLTKEEFLGYFGLKRKTKLDKKPIQRKRRSLAGCTKLYSDYV